MKLLKLSPHAALGSAGLQTWLDAGPTVAKFLDAFPQVRLQPGTLAVGRIYNADWDTNWRRGTPREWARAVVAAMAPTINAHPWIKAWELPPNEPVVNDRESMLWLAEFYYWAAQEMMGLKVRAVFGHWPVGNPTDLSLWKYYGLALEATRSFGAIHARHSYGPIDVWYALRHRLDAAEFEKLGFRNVPTIITECGADRVQKGWGAWKEMFGSFEDYWVQWCGPFAGAMAQDAYVLGGTLYTLGTGGDPRWIPFDVAGTGIENRVGELRLESVWLPPSGTHVVTATKLNVRQHPWLGNVIPKPMGQLDNGTVVTVLDECLGWGLIGKDGDAWVSMKWLKGI